MNRCELSVDLFLATCGVVRAQSANENLGDVPDGVSTADWSITRDAYEPGRHAIVADEYDSARSARNPGQRWTTRFDGRGATIVPDDGGWTWGLELASYGFAGSEIAVTKPVGARAEGSRFTYDWGNGVEEWYVNDHRGLEHGFTVRERPPHGENGSLRITLAMRGDLAASVDADGRGIRFSSALDYSGLTVFDAQARELPARIECDDNRIRITVDDRGAHYPMCIGITRDAWRFSLGPSRRSEIQRESRLGERPCSSENRYWLRPLRSNSASNDARSSALKRRRTRRAACASIEGTSSAGSSRFPVAKQMSRAGRLLPISRGGNRVDRGVASPAPHRSGRARFTHPALQQRGSLSNDGRRRRRTPV
jgi:hypothetical protein